MARVLRGRLPDTREPDVLFANPDGAANLGLQVGDSTELYVVPGDVEPEEVQVPPDQIKALVESGRFGRPRRFTLVGIGVVTSDVVPGATLPTILMTPAFLDTYRPLRMYEGIFVRLDDGGWGSTRPRGGCAASPLPAPRSTSRPHAGRPRHREPLGPATGGRAGGLRAGTWIGVLAPSGRRCPVARCSGGATRPRWPRSA